MTAQLRRPATARLGAALLAALAVGLAACTNTGGVPTAGPATQAPATVAPATQAPATTAPASAAPATTAPSGPAIALGDHPTLGEYLTDGLGKSLYLFTPDEDDQSTCADSCAASWPPFLVEAGQTVSAGEGVIGTIGVIERADGGMQVTYEKQPLYYFAGGTEIGDTTGHGVNEVWYLVSPEGDSVSTGGRGNY